MIPVRWRLREIRPNAWWAVDEDNGTAYGLDDAVASRLWANDDLLTLPLSLAVRTINEQANSSLLVDSPDGSFADLRFVGLTVRYRSNNPALVDQVAHDFAGAHARLRNSPDVIVELSDGVNVDRLHRSVDHRFGVKLRAVGEDAANQGSSEMPIVPPLQHAHFTARYCALHAALLATHDVNVIVCGVRKSGKTTTATVCTRLGIASVLTDELVLVHSSGDSCGVAMPIRERTGSDRISYPLDRTNEGARLVPIDHLVVLEPGAKEPGVCPITDVSQALQLVAPHLRPLSGPLGAATDNLLAILRRSQVWLWRLRPWPDLPNDIAVAASELLGVHAS
jgi:hypothetical protein